MGNKDTKIDDLMNVCRLCLGSNDLISVFDDRIKIPENMLDVIQVTTGVTISPFDNVSQKLCNKCLHITIKMYKFRSSSILNDMELKTRAAANLKPYINKSVEILLKKYPNIMLSPSISKCNISPVVVINKNEIPNWIEKHMKVKSDEKKIKDSNESKRTTPNTVIKSKVSAEVIDLEDKIMPYLIPNKEISATLQLPESTEKSPKPLQTLAPSLSPVMPKLTLEIDKQQNPIQKEMSPVNNDKKDDPESVITTKIQDKKSKRKLSVSINSDKSKKFKADSNSVDMENAVDSLVTLKYVTKSLLICDICNGILYTTKDLKKHKMNHMRCHLCKRSFRSLEETKEHSEGGCAIKQIMSNLPTIKLKRCDQSEEFRDQYPYLFGRSNKSLEQVEVCFLPPVELATNQSEESTKDPLEVEITKVKVAEPSPSGTEPLIEILLISDDENEIGQSSTSLDDINHNSCDGEAGKSASVPLESDANTSSNNLGTRPKKNKTEKKTNADKTLSTGSVKPNIQIIGENILDVDLDDNDISLLKNILKRTKKNLKETGVQTDLPCNADIFPSLSKDKLFELKDLKTFLNFYKIPVNVSFAAQYSVRYSYESSPLVKKDCSWSKVSTRVITASRTSPVNNISQSEALNNNTSNQVMNDIPTQALSSTSTEKSITSIYSVSNITSKTAQPPVIVKSPKESTCSVVTSSVPTILPTTATKQTQSINNLVTAGPSIPSNCYATNENSYTTTEALNKSLHSSTISQKTINYKLRSNSVLSQALTKLTHQQTINYISLNNKNYNNVTVAATINSSVQTSDIFRTPSVVNLPSLTSSNNILTIPRINSVSTPNNMFIPHIAEASTINPTSSISDIPIFSQSRSHLQPSSTITSNSENSNGQNFVPVIRVKDVSELR